MRFKFICWVMSLIVFFVTDAFSGEELRCSLTPDHPRCCLSNIHMLIHWKANLPPPSLKNDDHPFASDDSEIFLNIQVSPDLQKNGYNITSKEFPKITGGSQTYLMLPEICYSLDPDSGKVIYGISGKKEWRKGKITLVLRNSDGLRLSYTITTGTKIIVDQATSTGSGKVSRTYENLLSKLKLEDGVIVED